MALYDGEWPRFEVDHIDRDPSNDEWNNLRLASGQKQAGNRFDSKRNKSGIKGVRQLASGKWIAEINHQRKYVVLGVFTTKEEAIEIRREKGLEVWGEFDIMYDNKPKKQNLFE